MASAVVEMLTLEPCRKMMVFNTDLGLDSDTDTEMVNTVNGTRSKRALSETEEDQDKGHVKKRRKQSKPVRIASSESHSDTENYVENGTPEKRESDLNPSSNGVLSVNLMKESLKESVNDIECNGNKDCAMYSNREENFSSSEDSLLPINLSNAKCTENEIFANFVACQKSDNIQNLNNNNNLEKIQRNNEFASSSSSYQESHLDESNFEKDSVFVNSSNSPHSFPPVKSIHNVHIQNNTRHTASPVRIFNPEAFCDLCNKEFCNKYFLKTHKANKHGIYSEIGPNLMDSLPTLPFINYYSNVNEVLPTNNSTSRSVLRKPQLSTSCLPQPNSLYNLQKIGLTQNGNIRAFCNICHREFCNKYFVRRHKAKIHGIVDLNFPDTPPGELQEQKNQMDIKSCSGNHEKCEDHEIYLSGTEQKVASASIQAVPFNEGDKQDNRLSGQDNKTLNFVCEQLKTTNQSKEIELDDSANSSGVVRPNSNVSPTMSTTSLYQHDDMCKSTDSCDKLKRPCVPNSEAFCNICCKEYCNKYFLRTHKLKSHGIFQPDFDKRDERYLSLENNLSQGYNQNMPLNLIIGDQSVDKMETNSKEKENSEFLCDVCGKKFKTIFLLKMHTSYVHPQELYEKNANIDNNIQIPESSFKGKQVLNDNLNMLTESINKMPSDDKYFNYEFPNNNPTMLTCEICHKEVESSLMEAHIENEHGNILEDVSTIEEDNSDSQVFPGSVASKFECLSCHKRFLNTNLLNQHIIECHGTSNEQMQLPDMIVAKTIKDPEEPSRNNQLQSLYNIGDVQPTPTSSFCEICKKELCNKYFMKTHMQRMHGISIDNGAHIGGVVCDICNKELCSKYFLRVHKQNSHGIVDEILGLDISRNQSPSTDPSLRPNEQNDVNNRYFSHFTEVCTICSRRFRSLKWLKAHLLNDHGDEGKEKWREFQTHYEVRNQDKYFQDVPKKSDTNILVQSNVGINSNGNMAVRNYNDGYPPNTAVCQDNSNEETSLKTNVFTTIFNGKNTKAKQYNCPYCQFSTSILAFLFVHERSHINGSNLLLEQNKKFSCKICSSTFDNFDSYEKHCISHTYSEVTKATSINNDRMSKSALTEQESVRNLNSVESDMKDVATDSQTESNYYKPSFKCSQEIKLEDNSLNKKTDTEVPIDSRQGFGVGQSELDYLETYDGGLFENSRKDHVPYEKFQQNTETNVLNGSLSEVKQSLDFIANKIDIPVSFSVPQTQKEIIMQPFVLEDSGEHILSDLKKTIIKKSFLSSIVFLPVKEKLTNPVTVSFKLTPT